MKASTKTGTKAQSESISNVYGQDKVAVGSIMVMGGVSALIGVWALLSFTVALLGNGPVEMIKGFFSALMGI